MLAFSIRRTCAIGGAEEDRTPDLLCARQVLSQLSYGPRFVLCARYAGQRLLRTTLVNLRAVWRLVGLDGFEPSTSPLSGVRSNQLSYRPSQRTSWDAAYGHNTLQGHPTRASPRGHRAFAPDQGRVSSQGLKDKAIRVGVDTKEQAWIAPMPTDSR